MGAGASKVEPDRALSGQRDEGVKNLQQLNSNLVGRLEEKKPLETSEKTFDVSLPRQQLLDSSIQSKIKEEINRLKKQEADVRQQIEHALEKENLDRASQSASKGAKGKSSILLQQELEDVRGKIEKHNQRKSKVEKAPGVKQAREKVLQCYKAHPDRTLECWAEVGDFKNAVKLAEREFVNSMTSA